MTPLYKSRDIEPTILELAKHFRYVYVSESATNLAPIRVRKNLLLPQKVWLSMQTEKWKERGGIYITCQTNFPDHPYDVAFFIECPKSVDIFDRTVQACRSCAVVFYPPTWRLHEEAIAYRTRDKPLNFRQGAFDRLMRMRQLLDAAPEFTPQVARDLRHALLVPKPPLICAPEPAEHAGHAADTGQRVP